MRRMVGSLAMCLALFVAEMSLAHGANFAYIKLDGVAGDSANIAYQSWSEALSWSVGLGLAPQTGPAGARSFAFSKLVDRSSTTLAAAAATGARFKNAVLDVTTAGEAGMLVYRIILYDVTVRSYTTSGPSTNLPVENLELGYSRIEWYQWSRTTSGSIIQSQAKFDVARNALYP